MSINEISGVVFNLQHYSIHDGPGIRTTVFLKGCPLRCLWCQNPESQAMHPEIMLNLDKCTGCRTCVEACPEGAISMQGDKSVTDRERCTGCGACADVCPYEARTLMGKDMTAGEVFEDVNKDAIFYTNSGGGVTISGGDPVFQPDFSAAILALCQEAGIHTAIETSGFCKWDKFKKILDHADLVLYDIKHMDSQAHKECTGVPNELILDNARRIYHDMKLPMALRVPVIPGYNDAVDNLEKLANFVSDELGPEVRVHLLAYHRLGIGKNEQLEKDAPLADLQPPDEPYMEELKNIFIRKNLDAVLGG